MRVDAPDLRAHLQPQLGVQVGQRLVHQHQRRLDHDGARDRHALLLAAGQLAGQLVRLRLQPHQRQRLDPPAARSPPAAAAASPGRSRCSAAPSCAGTAHSSGTPCRSRGPPGPSSSMPPLVQPDRAAGQRQQSGEAVQRGGLAAARRAEQGDELAPLDRQRSRPQRVQLPEVAADPLQPQRAEVARDDRHAMLLADPRADLLVPALERIDQLVGRQRHSPTAPRRSACRMNGAACTSVIASWLSFGAIDSGTSFTAGPG